MFLIDVQAHTLWVEKAPGEDNNGDGQPDFTYKREGGSSADMHPGAAWRPEHGDAPRACPTASSSGGRIWRFPSTGWRDSRWLRVGDDGAGAHS